MRNANTAEVQQLWKYLREDGGWWTAKMLTSHLSPNFAEFEVLGRYFIALQTGHLSPSFAEFELQEALDVLEAGNFIQSRDHATATAYAYTSDCIALPEAAPVQAGGLAWE